MAKKVKIGELEFSRNDSEDSSVWVEDEYGESAVIDDIIEYSNKGELTFREATNEDMLVKIDMVLNSKVAKRIIKELDIQVNQAYQQHN